MRRPPISVCEFCGDCHPGGRCEEAEKAIADCGPRIDIESEMLVHKGQGK